MYEQIISDTGRFIFDYEKPLICTALHAGTLLSNEFADNMGITPAEKLREEDPHTDFLTYFAGNRIIAWFSRFEYDLNRPPEKAIYLEPADAWDLNVRKKPPTAAMLESARARYQEFYSLVSLQVQKMLQFHNQVLVLDLHSYNHMRNGKYGLSGIQLENPDIIICTGDLPPERCRLAQKLRNRLDDVFCYDRSLDVRLNVKFTGGYFMNWLNNKYPQVTCYAIEFKKIFMDEWTGEFNQIYLDQLRVIFRDAVHGLLK